MLPEQAAQRWQGLMQWTLCVHAKWNLCSFSSCTTWHVRTKHWFLMMFLKLCVIWSKRKSHRLVMITWLECNVVRLPTVTIQGSIWQHKNIIFFLFHFLLKAMPKKPYCLTETCCLTQYWHFYEGCGIDQYNIKKYVHLNYSICDSESSSVLFLCSIACQMPLPNNKATSSHSLQNVSAFN